MIVIKRLNNNVVIASESDGIPMVVMGKGVGYLAYPGDSVKKENINQTFLLQSTNETDFEKVSNLLQEIPFCYIETSGKIIQKGEEFLHTTFGIGLLVSLADHIYFISKRNSIENDIMNPLTWDIRQLYPKEMKMGEIAVNLIKDNLKMNVSEYEATSVAMHFINNRYNYDSMFQAMKFTKMISDIINIIQYHFQIVLNQNTISFSRFVTHLQFFLTRQMNDISTEIINPELMKTIISNYKNSFRCAEKIIEYMKKNYGKKASLEEETYLTLHIERIIKSK